MQRLCTVTNYLVAPKFSFRVRHFAMWLIMVAIVFAAIEGGAAAVYWLVVIPRAASLVWAPDLALARKVWSETPAVTDTELVWPVDPTAPPRDSSGAKYNADFPEPGRACVSAYGDSFVWGEDVPPAEGWIEQLSRLLHCRVANYGVSAYGTDQAYLRFRKTTSDEAPVVMLGIFPENLMRNVNQYRGLLGMGLQPSSVKGRYVLDAAGSLQWIARPPLGPQDVVTLFRRPADLLPHEYFLPDSRDGPVTPSLLHTVSLVRLALVPRVRTAAVGRPLWADFFADDHPSGALPLTVALVDAFTQEARQRHKRALVVILPSCSSFRGRSAHGEFEYAPLVAALTARGIDVIDGGTALSATLGARSYFTLYAQPATCVGHFGREGGAMMAEIVAAALIERGLVSEASSVLHQN